MTATENAKPRNGEGEATSLRRNSHHRSASTPVSVVVVLAAAALLLGALAALGFIWRLDEDAPPDSPAALLARQFHEVERRVGLSEADARLAALAAEIRVGREVPQLQQATVTLRRNLEELYPVKADWKPVDARIKQLQRDLDRDRSAALATLQELREQIRAVAPGGGA